jgi:uncharacterized protein YecE (DUF72 family)
MAKIRVGVSGWDYSSWRDSFYPADVRRRETLKWASRQFDTIEINGTFYSLKRPETYRAWYASAPRGFRYAVKGGRFITHNKKLLDVETPLANFFASGVLLLEEKLGPILWQLPGSLRFEPARLAAFLQLLPRDTIEASHLARRHDARLSGRAALTVRQRRPLRHVLEPRHESFFVPQAVELLRRHQVALAVSDGARIPYAEEITSGFVYVRLHGPGAIYASRYATGQLQHWAAKLQAWREAREPEDSRRLTEQRPPRRRGFDVYVYFDNDQDGYAPLNARELKKLLQSHPL